MSRAVRWAIAMTMFGIVAALVVYLITGSLWWSLIGVLGAGIVANSVIRPATRR